jgi:hypothetical protein
MPNVSRINGFRPARYANGAPYNGQVTRYFVTAGDTTAIFAGDLVKIDGGSDGSGVRSVTQAAANNAAVGVVVGFVVDPTNLNTPQYRAASTARYLLVADDPNILFEVQEDAVGGALPSAAVGLNANVVVGSGSTITGASAMQLDTSTTNTTNTLPLKIIEFVQREDNDIGAANARVLIKLNTHQLVTDTGSAGV